MNANDKVAIDMSKSILLSLVLHTSLEMPNAICFFSTESYLGMQQHIRKLMDVSNNQSSIRIFVRRSLFNFINHKEKINYF